MSAVSLTAWLETLADQLAAQLPGVHVSCDPPQARSMARLPAVVVDAAEFQAAGPNGDSRTLFDVRLELRALVDPAGERPHLAVRELAVALIQALQAIRRPVPGHGHVRVMRAGEDDFRPELDGYMVWLVDAAAELALGELEPVGPPPPSEVLVGYAPNVGPGHLGDYRPLQPGEVLP